MSAAIRQDHPGTLALRRLLAGEAVPEIKAHADGCEDCKARLKEFHDEQRRFEEGISFERFAAGVERAARTPREVKPSRNPVLQVVLSLAAMALVVVGFGTMFGTGPINRIKGGGVDVVVAGKGGQRPASENPLAPEALARGELVQIGFSPGTWHYMAVLSIDEAGVVTPLYPSMAVTPESPRRWLPDSFEFTGRGIERVVVVMSNQPTDMQTLAKEAKRRYDEASGDVSKMSKLDIPGEQFHRTFLKP